MGIPFRLANTRFHIQSCWNICSGDWLKYYIYLRIPPKYIKMVNPVVFTFMVSAFWHGFYPGYYFFFILYAFYYKFEEAIDYNFKRVYIMKDRTTPKNPTTYKCYIVAMTFITWFYINSITITFRLLDLSGTLNAWNGIFWVGHILGATLFILFKFVLVPKKPTPIPAPTKKE